MIEFNWIWVFGKVGGLGFIFIVSLLIIIFPNISPLSLVIDTLSLIKLHEVFSFIVFSI